MYRAVGIVWAWSGCHHFAETQDFRCWPSPVQFPRTHDKSLLVFCVDTTFDEGCRIFPEATTALLPKLSVSVQRKLKNVEPTATNYELGTMS